MVRHRRLPHMRGRFRMRNRQTAGFLRLCAVITVGLILIYLLDARLRPVIRDYSYARAVYLATSTLNDAVNEEITNSGVAYNDLIYLEKDNDGRVTALHTNIVKINTLKSSVTNSVIDRLNALDAAPLTIPLGSISGIDLFAGIGPDIRIKIAPVGQATANFGSEFTSAGINQTRHSITMQVSASVTIILPRDSIETEVTTHVDVAETVIVGIVPDTYTNVEDASNGDMTEKIFDFAQIE